MQELRENLYPDKYLNMSADSEFSCGQEFKTTNKLDRRQQKTRRAIFKAFCHLISKHSYANITVQQIIDEADVGRSTFYAHFPTKDDLLKAVCVDLFHHIIEGAKDSTLQQQVSLAEGHEPTSVFCHLLQHLKENDRNILGLLSSTNSEFFLGYFKEGLRQLMASILAGSDNKLKDIPEELQINFLAAGFIELILWWNQHQKRETPQQLDAYFRALIKPVLGE